MDDDRIATVIKEIQYWKEHKLLPEMYCDYLLTLYTNGEGRTNPSMERMPEQGSLKPLDMIQYTLSLLLIPFSLLVIYFTEFHPIMQLSILFLCIGISFWQCFFYRSDMGVLARIALFVLLVLIMLFTMLISNEYIQSPIATNSILFLQFIGWLYYGFKNRMIYLRIASIIGILFTLFMIVQ